jgi:hypothetical protein
MMRTLAALAVLSASAGCGGTPDAERSRLEVFDALAKLMLDYNEALGRGEPVPIEAHTVKLQKFVSKEFEAVLEGLGSNDPDRRAVAAFALGFSRNRGAVAPLEAASSAPEPGVRANAVASLGVLGFEDVPVEPFRKLLEDPHATVREAVLFGLRQLVDEKNDRGLLEAVHARLSDAVANVRNEALILLRKCRRGESVQPILKTVVRDREPLVRMNAAVTLGKIGAAAQAATPALVEMLRDEESKVVDAAYKALNLIHEKDFDRSYGTWKDWYEDEQRHHYLCLDHKDAAFAAPGDCRSCGKKLERVLKDTVKRSEPVPSFFTCPDHPEIQTASPSACGKPGCGRTLVASKPPPALYRCPDHLEVMTTSPAICGKSGCGKALVPAAPKK